MIKTIPKLALSNIDRHNFLIGGYYNDNYSAG